MRSFIVACSLLIGSITYGQDYHYKFSLNGVVDLPTAKDIKDPLRAKFQCYTVFDDTIGYFEFNSRISVSESELQEYLAPYGHTLTSFSKHLLEAEIETEEETE